MDGKDLLHVVDQIKKTLRTRCRRKNGWRVRSKRRNEKRKLLPDFHTRTLKKDYSIKTDLLWYFFQEVIGNFRNLCWCSVHFTRKPVSICKVRVCTDSLEIPSKSTSPDGWYNPREMLNKLCRLTCIRMNCFIRMANGVNHQVIFSLLIVYADIPQYDICE